MTLEELQNKMMIELSRSYPNSGSLFNITKEIFSKHQGSLPEGPPLKRLLDDGFIDPADDGIGYYKLTSKGKKFIEAGGYGNDLVPVNEPQKKFWKKIFK